MTWSLNLKHLTAWQWMLLPWAGIADQHGIATGEIRQLVAARAQAVLS